jgi:hypothetical protein
MSLPKIDIVTFTTELPSNKQKIIFRPFLVKEEKILLMATKSDNQEDQINAIKQVINNCVQTEINVDKIPLFDLEWLFLQLRIQSISDVLDLKFKHKEGDCDHIQNVSFDLKEVQMKHRPSHNKEIKLNEDITVFLKYPTVESASIELDDNIDNVVSFLSEGIEFIKHKEEIIETKEYTKQEKREFFEQLNQKQMIEIQKFYETQPTLEHEMKYVCDKCKSEETILLRGLQDFLA